MKQPKYLNLAADIEQAIRTGALAPGARLPSVRDLMAQRRMSLSTVTSALRRLEEAGLVEPRAKQGYFVKPEPRSAEADRGTGRAPGADDLELGAPAPDLYPAERFKKLMASLVRRHPLLTARVPRRSVNAELATQLARRSAEYGCFLRETDIVLTQGDTEALSLALRACAGSGDAVLVQAPIDPWVGCVIEALELGAVSLRSAPGAGLVEAVESALADKASARVLLINPSFHHPTGEVLSIAEKRALLRVCAKADLTIIEDDRFGDLQHYGARPLPIKAFDTEDHVVYLNSCCRSLAPGLQIGWLAAGPRRRVRIEALKRASSSNVSELSQLALAEFLARGSHAPHLRKLRQRLKQRSDSVFGVLSTSFGEPAARRVAGGYSYWLPSIEPPDEARVSEIKSRWPELFVRPSPVLAFIGRGLYVNASHDLDAAQLAALGECCRALEARRPSAAGRSEPPARGSVSPD